MRKADWAPGMGSVRPPSEVFQKRLPEMELSKEERTGRINRIAKRANALMRDGFYDRQDVEGVREMVRNGMCLVQVEWLLLDAEEQARRRPS